ncbi:hypothetical protein [Cystobacter ferrugineus]|uniref:hypothetical protein n=1 Tax=Cystobacter ferrugineus TaxID=83449 RepID=UPI0011614DBD|nr:hypothetical protein [Cystobacter ferrugineus]
MANIVEKASRSLVVAWMVAVLPTSSLAFEEKKPSENLKNLIVAATTTTVCASTLTPSGWVDIQWWNSASCGSTFAPNIKMIQEVASLPVGTTITACASTYPPPGWVQTGASFYRSTCRYSVVPSLDPNAWTLKRVY